MSLSETMKAHMEAVRGVTGVNGLLSMAMATSALNSLERFEIKTNEEYRGSLNNIDHSSILFVVGEKEQSASAQSQNVPVDGRWWLVLTITSINGGGRKWQFAASDSDLMLFYRVNSGGDHWFPWSKLGGEVTKRLLFSLVPRIGGACYAA